MTVWVFARRSASGPHMSPVSPKPWISTTAGPLPPARTKIVAPSGMATVRVAKPGTGAGAAAGACDGNRRAAASTQPCSKRVVFMVRLVVEIVDPNWLGSVPDTGVPCWPQRNDTSLLKRHA